MGNAFKKADATSCEVEDYAKPLPNTSVQPLIRYSLSFDMHVLRIHDQGVPTSKERRCATDLIRNPYFWADYISAAVNHALNTTIPTPIFNLEVNLWRSKKNETPGFYTGRVSWIAARTPHLDLRAELEWAIEDRMTQYGLSDYENLFWNIHILTIMHRGRVTPDTVLQPVFEESFELSLADVI